MVVELLPLHVGLLTQAAALDGSCVVQGVVVVGVLHPEGEQSPLSQWTMRMLLLLQATRVPPLCSKH